MALVDYSSSDSESETGEAASTTAKRQKTSHDETSGEQAALPPLPDAFHDLYASTVRVSTTDDPTLHQGRKRVNPHRVGNWPSHLYIEWHPTPSQRHTLTSLLSTLQPSLASLSVGLTSFLTSDLGAPQPLHVSLSRPIVLSTPQKDAFLAQLLSRIEASGVAPFDLAPRGLEWHRTRESARSFLVLRVGSTSISRSSSSTTTGASTGTEGKRELGSSGAASTSGERRPQNPELTTLLQRCNALVKEFGQPPLYALQSNNGDDAFHVSIAWSFAVPTLGVRECTKKVFAEERDAVLDMRVPVRGIKAKIGNAVTHIGLPVLGKRSGGSLGLTGS
ncbi:U6 snRNA phosphodiesterase Usb1 [Hypomontagnella monticulosa]|nr:U6 snRNA phosphodiesterase Usb1 [Hypomontagnella monticulosa]